MVSGSLCQVHRDAGREAGEGQITAQAAIDEERQLLNGFVIDDRAEIAAIGLQQRSGRFHLDRFLHRADLHLDVEACRGVDLHNDVGRFRLAETFLLGDDIVAAGREREERVSAFCVGLYRDVLAGRRVGQRNLRRRHNGPGGVGHLTGDGSAILPIQQGAEHQKHENNKVSSGHTHPSKFVQLSTES